MSAVTNKVNNNTEQDSKYYKLLKWNAVTMWVYDTTSDICSICRNALREACITCQANQEKFESKECKKVIGKCNHCFHAHCINEWTKKQNQCPMDLGEWIPIKFD